MAKGLSQIPWNKNGKLTVLTELMVNDIALKTPWNEHLQGRFYVHVQSVLMENVANWAITSSLCATLAEKAALSWHISGCTTVYPLHSGRRFCCKKWS